MARKAEIADRVKDFRRVRGSELRPHPSNWRRHPQSQLAALQGVLSEVGFAGACLAYEEGGELVLIDGHARAELAGDARVPVVVLDVDGEEAKKLLATYDPLGAMARPDQDALLALLREARFEDEAVNRMLESVANGETAPMPELGPELDESVADGVSLCRCAECGHEHHRVSK